MIRLSRILAPLFALAIALPVKAHEFWISPQAYIIAAGETILADLRVGQELSGTTYSYIPQNITRFDVLGPEGLSPVTGRVGDRPAANFASGPEGLLTLIHETTDSILTYRDFQKFVAFTEHKDFTWAIAEHAARGIPEFGFKETYRRYAKALIAVGDGAGQDTRVGLNFELVALSNPYTDPIIEGLQVQLWLGDAPLPDTQIEVFAKDMTGQVTVTKYLTDEAGMVTLPMAPNTEYLVDSVILSAREPSPETQEAVWHSDWAALTFKTGSDLGD